MSRRIAIDLYSKIIQDMLYKHDYDHFHSDKPSERMKAITETMDFVIGLGEDEKNRFLNVVTELAKAFALCATTPEAKDLKVEIGFFKAVRASIVKLIPTDDEKKTSKQVDARLNPLISKSVISDEVIDIYSSLGIDNPDISILSDEFLNEVKALPEKM